MSVFHTSVLVATCVSVCVCVRGGLGCGNGSVRAVFVVWGRGRVSLLCTRGCHKDAQPSFLFLLRQPLSDFWWLPTNRHRLPSNRHRLHTNRHRLHTNRHQLPTNRHQLHTNRHRLPTNRHRLPTNCHRLHTNRHRLHTNRHRLHTNRHRLPTNRHQLPTGRHHRAYWTLRVFFIYFIMATPALHQH